MPKYNMVLLKTDEANIRGVLQTAKHASDGKILHMFGGGFLLIQVATANARSPVRIDYVMTYVRCYKDKDRESDKIFGKHWEFIIQGRDVFKLRRPFSIRDVQVTEFPYEKAQRFAYVRDPDVEAIRNGGYLAPAELMSD